MAASIAHELGQPLAAIISYATAARHWLSRDPPTVAEARNALTGVQAAAEHAKDVIGRLRNFVRHSTISATPIRLELRSIIEDAQSLIKHELTDNQTLISTTYTEKSMGIIGDQTLLMQAVINILLNAIHAMTDTDKCDRIVTIHCSKMAGDIVVAVSDNGIEWSDDVKRRALGSLYTTASSDVGLGLSVVKKIMEAHQGTLTLLDGREGGALVELRVPAAPGDQSAE